MPRTRTHAKAMFLLSLACLAGCAAPRVRLDPVDAKVLEKAGLQYYWKSRIVLQEGERIREMIRLDENLYCLTTGNRLLAVSAETGLPKWSRRIADPGREVFRPVHASGVILSQQVAGIHQMLRPQSIAEDPRNLVLINTVANVLVLDRATGQEVRDIPLSPPALTGGGTDGAFFIVPALGGRYYGVSLPEAINAWTRSADKDVVVPPRCEGSLAYVASEDGRLYAVQIRDRPKEAWSQKTGGPLTADFYVDSRGVFVGSQDGCLYAFDSSGRSLWNPVSCNAPLRDPIQVGAGTVFQYARGGEFYAVNLANGTVRWRSSSGRLVLSVMEGKVYLLDARRNLQVVDEVLGKVQATLPLTALERFAPNATAPAIYAATADGYLYCLRLLTAGHLTAEMLQSGKP